MTTVKLLSSAWDWAPLVPLICVGALGTYAWWHRRHGTGRPGCFVAAVGLFFLALASPIGVLARGYLFSAHMAQHLILLLGVPPLALLGLSPRHAGGAADADAVGSLRYAGPWLAGVGGMWIWHERTLCNVAAVSAVAQWAQIVSLIALGVVFWRPLLGPSVARFPPFAAILYLFSACVACTILGVLIAFSPIEICDVYLHPVDALGVLPLLRKGWGLSASADQEIGGLMMWVPACLVYASAILAIQLRYYRDEARATLAAVDNPGPGLASELET